MAMEGELSAVRECGEGTPDSSLNIAFEVKVCDIFREALNSKVGGERRVVAVERVFGERLSTCPVKDEQYEPVENKETFPDALEIKHEPVEGEQDWSGSVLLSEDWLEEDPKPSQSQSEQKMSEEDACGTLGAAAANSGEGPLCKEEEKELQIQPCLAGDPEKGLLAKLKQEPDGEPLTPGHPLPGSTEGLEVQCAWSKATRSGNVQEMLRHHGGGSELGGPWSNDRFSPHHFKASHRPCSVKNEGPTSHLEQQQNGHPRGPLDCILTEMAFPLGSQGKRIGSAPCEESFDASAEAESHRRIEGLEEFVCTCCGKTFPNTLGLKTHQQKRGMGRWFGCSECGKRFPCKGYLKTHQKVHTGEKPYSCIECGKSFAQLYTLKRHQRIHTGEKPFSCSLCGRGFSQNHVLQRHILSHTKA